MLQVRIYAYNWAKDLFDRLQNHLTLTLKWMMARQALLNSIAMQKLGILEEQPYTRKSDDENNPFINKLQLVDNLVKLQVPSREVISSVQQQVTVKLPSVPQKQQPLKFTSQQQQLKFIHQQRFGMQLERKQRVRQASMNNSSSYRTTIGSAYVWTGRPAKLVTRYTDQLQTHGKRLLALTAANARRNEIRERLGQVVMCGSSATNSLPLLDNRTLSLVCRHARIQHYVYSPMLFLPRWRLLVAATRDHTIKTVNLPVAPATQQVSQQPTERNRHDSGTSTLRQSFMDLRRGSVTSLSSMKALQQRKQHNSPASSPHVIQQTTPPLLHTDALNVSGRRRHITGSNTDDRWHLLLCTSLLKEYIQYLQSHGFKTLPKHAVVQLPTSSVSGPQEKLMRVGIDDGPSTTYLIMSLRAGVIILKMFFKEPFFGVIIYTIENNRLRRRPYLYTPHATTDQLLSEIDNARVLLHVHSFVHDFHLRTLGAYLAGRQLIFNRGYHLSAFLSNFTQYYSKAANFARNMIHSDSVCIHNTGVSPEQLYNYLLSKENQYDMKVMRMTPIVPDESLEMQETEYVLVQVQTCHTRHQPHQARLAEEYESILLVARDNSVLNTSKRHINQDEASLVTENNLYLKYYLILTSKREMYPSHVSRMESDRRGRRRQFEQSSENTGRYRTFSTAPSACITPRTGSAASRKGDVSTPHTGSDNVSEEDESQAKQPPRRDDSDTGGSSSSTSNPPSNAPLVLGKTNGEGSKSAQDDGVSCVTSAVTTCTVSGSSTATPSDSPKHPSIKKESVNYHGFFSLYEVTMEQLLLSQARLAVNRIQSIFKLAKIHCRRDNLWKRLTIHLQEEDLQRNPNRVSSFSEVDELLQLVQVENIEDHDPRLATFVEQSLPWHQALARLLQQKYNQNVRSVTSSDGNQQHVVVMSPTCPELLMFISMDLREPNNTALRCMHKTLKSDPKTLLVPRETAFMSAFVNICCFHLWSSKL